GLEGGPRAVAARHAEDSVGEHGLEAGDFRICEARVSAGADDSARPARRAQGRDPRDAPTRLELSPSRAQTRRPARARALRARDGARKDRAPRAAWRPRSDLVPARRLRSALQLGRVLPLLEAERQVDDDRA